MDDLLPVAVAGPVLTPPVLNTDNVTPGSPVQEQGSPQQLLSAGVFVGPNTITNLSGIVPAGKVLVVTSFIVSVGSAAQQVAIGNGGATTVAQVFLNPGQSADIGVGVTLAAGQRLQLDVFNQSGAFVSCKATWYIADAATSSAPAPSQLAASPALG